MSGRGVQGTDGRVPAGVRGSVGGEQRVGRGRASDRENTAAPPPGGRGRGRGRGRGSDVPVTPDESRDISVPGSSGQTARVMDNVGELSFPHNCQVERLSIFFTCLLVYIEIKPHHSSF